MALIEVVRIMSATGLIGTNVIVFLNSKPDDDIGIDFYVTEAGDDYIYGHDDEGFNMRIDIGDIRKVLGPFDKRGGYIHHEELQKRFDRKGKRKRI